MSILPPLLMMEEANTSFQIKPTNLSNIFIPHGNLIPKADFATLKIMVNVSAIFDESREVCLILDAIKNHTSTRMQNEKLLPYGKLYNFSDPDKKLLDVIAQNIRDLCNHDRDVLEQLKTSFGLTEMGKIRTERQFIFAATVAITSLITFFSTKELISMSSDEDDDELYDATNHIITAIENHETRLVRLD